jgi:DeoR/GlpR family transcriptional regulator of sugar metabolism
MTSIKRGPLALSYSHLKGQEQSNMSNSIRRRNEIIQRVKNEGNVNVEELVQKHNVSVETIRRDLRILDEKGLVKRTYGGAAKREQTTWEMPYNERISLNHEKKEAISLEAIKLLEDGDSLFLDGNTTCLTLSRHIPSDLELLIVTNSPSIALYLMQKRVKSKIFLVGGELSSDGMTSGHKLHQELKQYRFDKAMFSCAGLTTQGCFYSKIEPLRIAQTIAEQSNQLILLADSSKMNRTAFMFGFEAKRVDVLVTDDGAPTVLMNKLKEHIKQIVVTNN